MKTAAELIAHLESGGLIARGDPDRPQYLRLEIWKSDGRVCKYLGVYGWGSALGRPIDRLESVLMNPHEWVIVKPAKSNNELDEKAKKALLQIGEYDQESTWKWIVTAQDERQPNAG